MGLGSESGVKLGSPPAVNPSVWWDPALALTVEPMAAPVQRRYASRYRRVPWSPRAWSQLLYLAGGIPAQLAALLLVVAGFLARPRWLLPVLFLMLVFLAVPVLTQVQRHRLRATARLEIPPQPRTGNRWSVPGMVAYARSQATWRQLCYHLLAAPALAAASRW